MPLVATGRRRGLAAGLLLCALLLAFCGSGSALRAAASRESEGEAVVPDPSEPASTGVVLTILKYSRGMVGCLPYDIMGPGGVGVGRGGVHLWRRGSDLQRRALRRQFTGALQVAT